MVDLLFSIPFNESLHTLILGHISRIKYNSNIWQNVYSFDFCALLLCN